MDPYSFNVDTTSELRLRWHIREILLPYARVHLTSDHVVYTEKVVEEILLRTLEYVPMADATSFRLPSDPIENFIGSLHSLDLAPPEERWTTPSEHVRYLKTFIPPPPSPHDLPTEKYWVEDDNYVKLSLICRPTSSPVLSKRARDETPVLGSTGSRAAIPHTRSALGAFLDLNLVPAQYIQDLPAPPVDDVLGLRLQLDSATGARIRPFLQSVSARVHPMSNCFDGTPHVPEFLQHASPPRPPPSLDSPPLFSRIAQDRSVQRRARNNIENGASNPTRVSELASILRIASPQLIDGEDGDISGRLMEVVSGWTTLTYSSPALPSLHSSDGSEIDGLWDISPPGTPPTSSMAAKMDEVEIPRVRKFGHKNTLVNEGSGDVGAPSVLAVANSPGFFITSFISAPIPMTQKPITSQLEGVGFGMHPPRSLSPGLSMSNSLLRQPPSPPGKQTKDEITTGIPDCVEDPEQSLDDAVAGIYASTPQDPLSYIIDEKIDEKEIMLMDVPNLPPPTVHPRDPTLFPEGLQSFVAPKGVLSSLDTASQAVNCVGPTAFLRPVKGIKPLALDLSWRPFNFGKAIPTDEEVAGISKAIQPEDNLPGYHDEKFEETVNVLIDLDTCPISAEDVQATLLPKPPRGCEGFGMSPTPKRTDESVHVEYLLTRRERMRASGAELTLDIEAQSDVGAEQDNSSWLSNDEHGDLRHEYLRLPGERGSRDVFDPMQSRSQNQTDHIYPFNHSGVDIMDNDLGQFSTGELGVPHLLLQPHQDDLLLYDVDASVSIKGNIDDSSENKENIPPGNVGNCHSAESQDDALATQYDWSGYFQFPESDTFEPLSFASQTQPQGPSCDQTNSKAQGIPPLTPNTCHVQRPEDHSVLTSKETDTRATKRRKLDELVPTSSKDLFSTFIGLRNQATSSRILEDAEAQDDTSTPHQTLDVPEQTFPRATPDDVFDQHTVRLPEPWIPAAAVHRYLASVSLIQKRALVCELQGHHCRVDLVERRDLGGTDIIIDPDSGVLFIPLLALPAHLDSTLERISRESWRYMNLLVVLEAYPSAQSYRVDRSRDNKLVPYAYTPPICKAIRKLRRNLAIAEGCGSLNPRCTIPWAFANDVEEAAKFVRCFAEEACAISKERGREILWDEREWLEEEEREGESDLAGVHGMNAFAAFVMLYDRSIEAILELSPEARLADFGLLLGEERMTALNSVMESRMQDIAADIGDSVVDPAC